MGVISQALALVFRPFSTDGVAASGLNQVDKAAVRALGPLIEEKIGLAGLGALIDVVYATRDELDADLAHDAGKVALVYADATDANNDLYVKTGASGAGGWTLTTALHDIVEGLTQGFVTAAETAAALAEAWAEGDGHPGGGDTRSAKWWASKFIGSLDTLEWGMAFTTEDGLRAFGYVDADGHFNLRARPVRQVTAAAGAEWTAWTVLDGDTCEVWAQEEATGRARRVVASDTVYREVESVAGGNIVVKTGRGRTEVWGAADSHVGAMATTDGATCWGDSLTGGSGGFEYPASLAELLADALGRDIPVHNAGIGGQTSSEIAARADALALTGTVSGGTIPARMNSADIALTGGEKADLTVSQTPMPSEQGVQQLYGTLGGLAVAIFRDAGDGSLTVARRFLGPAAAIPDDSELRIDAVGVAAQGAAEPIADLWQRVQIIGLGNNPNREHCSAPGILDPDFYDAEVERVIADIAAMIARCEAVNARFLIRTSVRPMIDDDDTPERINAAILARWPNHTSDIRALLMASGDGSPGDLADIAAGNVPGSLRIDGIHLTQAAHDLCAGQAFDLVIEKGWFQ